jgi:hypothetical protein
MCGTGAEIVLICFSELELEVLGRSNETLNTGNFLPFLSPYQEWAYSYKGGHGDSERQAESCISLDVVIQL